MIVHTFGSKILEEKIRLRKPLLQPFDGPYNRTNNWLRQFYSGEKHYWASNNGYQLHLQVAYIINCLDYFLPHIQWQQIWS